MELSAMVRALGALTSPLDWGDQEAWLAECLLRVREALGAGMSPGSEPVAELEELVRMPDDEPGWLRTALGSEGAEVRGRVLPSPVVSADPTLVSLRCALDAGLASLERLRAWRGTLGQAFDGVDTGMAILTADGRREVARNARWDRLLLAEPDRERLRAAIVREAARAAMSTHARGESDVDVDLPGGTYRVVASRMSAGTLLVETAVLVLLDRQGPELPTTQELRVSFGLRGREPQVALLAAEGLSNADIARRLRLSAHTVRHYLERVLERLGLHSRKALALRLMASPPGGGGQGGPDPLHFAQGECASLEQPRARRERGPTS
jgi:DNA-binding NarL/FixJ family response regulator